jgi:hypothetical protein
LNLDSCFWGFFTECLRTLQEISTLICVQYDAGLK